MMTHHCKNCLLWHNAGHPADHKMLSKYNDWCCKYGKPAGKAVGRCKLNNSKQEVEKE